MGEGERAEAARRRQSLMFIAGSAAIAVVMVVGSIIFKQNPGRMVPGWAIAFVGLFLLAMFATWRQTRRVADEVEKRDTINAMAAGFVVYFLGAPSWYFLARGNLVPEPDQQVIFVVVFVTAMATYFWRKLR